MDEVSERRAQTPQQDRHTHSHPELLASRRQLDRLDAVRHELGPSRDCRKAQPATDGRQGAQEVLDVGLVAGTASPEHVGVDDDEGIAHARSRRRQSRRLRSAPRSGAGRAGTSALIAGSVEPTPVMSSVEPTLMRAPPSGRTRQRLRVRRGDSPVRSRCRARGRSRGRLRPRRLRRRPRARDRALGRPSRRRRSARATKSPPEVRATGRSSASRWLATTSSRTIPSDAT